MDVKAGKARRGVRSRTGRTDARERQAVLLPVQESAAFEYGTAHAGARLSGPGCAGHSRRRFPSPADEAVAAKAAGLEGGAGVVPMRSGQAANVCGDIAPAHERERGIWSKTDVRRGRTAADWKSGLRVGAEMLAGRGVSCRRVRPGRYERGFIRFVDGLETACIATTRPMQALARGHARRQSPDGRLCGAGEASAPIRPPAGTENAEDIVGHIR